jgi:tetrahydromethanopterin S-methyltransferase subunit C
MTMDVHRAAGEQRAVSASSQLATVAPAAVLVGNATRIVSTCLGARPPSLSWPVSLGAQTVSRVDSAGLGTSIAVL